MQAIWRRIAPDPLTWAALGISFAFALVLLSWFPLGTLGRLAVLSFALATTAAWIVTAAVSGRYLARDRAALKKRADGLAASRSERIRAIAAEFESLSFRAGQEQLTALGQKFDALADIVERRLDAGELAYGRYLGVAEQVYLSSIDNLSEVAIALRSVSTVDRQALEAKLATAKSEAGALAKRVDILDAQQARIAELMAQNEAALTALVETATALAETRTRAGEARMPAETAIAELERLAAASSRYAIRQ